MGFPTSLIGRHDYLNALSALGIVLDKPAFPVVLSCPLCRQSALYLFDDIVTNGIWFSCDNCQGHGDIITFGAQVWNLSLPDTLEKFSDLSLLNPDYASRLVPEYTRLTAKIAAAEEFLGVTVGQTWSHSDDFLACRIRKFGIRYENPLLADVIGVAQYDQTQALCRHLGRTKPPQTRDDGCALVFPFYDLPQRLTGCLLVQYDKNFDVQQNFIPINNYKRRKTEAGYFLLHKLLRSNIEIFRGAQFASEDLYWVMRAQARYANKFNEFLPLVASYTGPEAESYGVSWNSFHPTTRIFHAETVTPGVVSRACSARGYAATCSTKRPTDIANLISIRARTKTWQETLKNALLAENEIHAQSFATQLSVPHDKLSVFFSKFEHPFSPGFSEHVLADLRMGPAAPQDRWLIIEKDTSWWNHNGRRIANIRPQITKIIQADTGEQLYCGTITADDGEIFSFTDTASKIEQVGLLAYCRAVLAQHKKLVIYDRVWNGRSIVYALQLHPPELSTVSKRCGWDTYNKTFRFNRYEINATGRVVPITPWPDTKNTLHFDEPTVPAPLPIRALLSPAHENSYTWCVVAGVLSHLLAPVLNHEPAAIGIPAKNFNATQAILQALCCPVERATAASKVAARYFCEQFNTPRDWPTLVYNTFSDQALSNIVPKHFNTSLLVKLSDETLAVAPGYGWWTVQNANIIVSDVSVLRHVIPGFIQHVFKNNLTALSPAADLPYNILSELHRWFQNIYGATFNLPHAKTILTGPNNAHIAVFSALNNGLKTGTIVILPRPRRRDQARNYLVKQPGTYWVSRHAVDRYFWFAKSPPPNWAALIELLDQEGVYKGEQTIQNMTGIVVSDTWCDQFWTDDTNHTQAETG